MKRKTTFEIITLLLLLLYVYTAASKLSDYKTVLFNMNSQPFDDAYSPYIVFGLVGAEFIVGAMLVFRRTVYAGLWASLGLLGMFTAYIILIKANYFGTVPCSCGGVISQLTWTQHLYFNLFFIGLNVLAIVLYKQMKRGSDANANENAIVYAA
ncbi:MauE/DoxX family redox-associated membrane protein [Chitinophaga lutea]